MMSGLNNPYQQYQKQKENEITTSSSIELITRLLEGVMAFNKKAILAVESGEKVKSLEMAERGQRIVLHLYSCLDFEKGGTISDNLADLYRFCLNQYVQFLKGAVDKSLLESVNKVIAPIHEGWRQIEGQENELRSSGKLVP